MSPEYCKNLANKLREALQDLDKQAEEERRKPKALSDKFDGNVSWPGDYQPVDPKKKEIEDDVKYAAWWLDFVADNADGSSIWY